MRHTFFATCAPGVEPLLHAEVKRLGLARPERQVGGVRFEGTLRDAQRANLWLRTAVRVLQRLSRFEAADENALYRGVSAIDWSQHLAPEGRLWIDAQVRDSALTHSHFVAQRVKDAVVDALRTPSGTRPVVERQDADLRLHLHLFRDRATLSLDTSGESLHRRGWRRTQATAPLSETLAAAMLLASDWDLRSPLIDPFCGGGTLLIEAGLLATHTAPGLFRECFGFERWPGHDAAAFEALKEEARAQRRPAGKLRLVGRDWDPARLEETRTHGAVVGLAGALDLDVAEASQFDPRPGWNAWIVTNPPYGGRVGEIGKLTELYRSFGRRLREHCAGYHLALLCGEPLLTTALGLLDARHMQLQNGGIACELILADL